jgi:hypothetical protein
MEVAPNASLDESQVWGGGNKPFNASYGKMMMWFFIVSDALTFLFLMVFQDLRISILGLLLMKYLPIFPFYMVLMPQCIM